MLDCAESAFFLIINYYCGIVNTYLCLGWCFMGILSVFHKNFEGSSRSFHECFQKDLNICMGVVHQGCLRIFLWKKGLVLCTKVMVATHASSIEQKHP